MAKNDSKPAVDTRTATLTGVDAFDKLGGIELDLGRKFFKPRIVPLNSICKGFLWGVREFPNHINPDTGKIMKALVIKLTQDCPAAGDKDSLVTVDAGQEIMIPLNFQIEPLEQFGYLETTCHEVAIMTLEEKPLKGKDAAGKDVPKTMRGFRYKVIRAYVSREEAEQIAAPRAIKQLQAMAPQNGSPSLPARS